MRHHPFAECKAWGPQIRRLLEGVGKDCEWERPRAPAARPLWDVRAPEAVVGSLGATRVGFRAAARVIGPMEGADQSSEDEGKEGGPGPP